MNDLNQIAKLNAAAMERDIPNQQALGHFVVAEYHGLHFVGYTNHTTHAEASAKACEIGKQPGCRSRVLFPTKATA